MRHVGFIMLAACFFLATGCTAKQAYQGVYEGFRARNQLETGPAERLNKPEPDNYGQYEQERKERLQKDVIDSTTPK